MTKKRILVVSGDPELLRILQHNLPQESCEVATGRVSGEDLKEVLDVMLPDLIILDIQMPWLDGIELCLRIRQWCQAPVIMLSTWGATRDTVRGLDLSSDCYLTDPFDATELVSRIEETLSRN
ncbi:response regulator transcription factor [Chloroflexota bacterium]